MTTFTVTVNIQPKALASLKGYRVCLAKPVGQSGGPPAYNVVALASIVTANNVIKFTDTFSIYGTLQTFNAGSATAQGNAPTLPITYGEAYHLPDWTDPPSVGNSTVAPAAGFAFINGVQASVVVALQNGPTVGGNSAGANSPFYISPSPDIPGTDTLTPVTEVALWFQRDIVTTTMIDLDMSTVHVMNLTGQTTVATTYTDSFQWQDDPSKVVDYTKVAPAAVKPIKKVEEKKYGY
ncbi:hypothetical protein CPB83DRAFT_901053 [Crepidotus variabilis]|uniref:Uncharacterized protein n=1 Tax=Crepidotus variabilis TaxID=179855 RepID=A0A9P6ESG6_9AGAR|nr:hypothetical protein CPB83DRAFT_901053 [Crepidotus variabilis]